MTSNRKTVKNNGIKYFKSDFLREWLEWRDVLLKRGLGQNTQMGKIGLDKD